MRATRCGEGSNAYPVTNLLFEEYRDDLEQHFEEPRRVHDISIFQFGGELILEGVKEMFLGLSVCAEGNIAEVENSGEAFRQDLASP